MCVKTCKYISATGISEQKSTKSKSSPTTFADTLQQGEADETWATSDVRHDDNAEYLAAAIRVGTAIAVSDGSYKTRSTDVF
eukprot:12018408-Ditylum_brightwellii.AAC.1